MKITKEQWYRMLDRNCRRDKHRFRTNKFGVTWCVICGLLSTKVGIGTEIEGDEALEITCDEDR